MVQIALIQSDVADATETTRLFQSTISDADVFRQGPPVPGFSQATCVLPPGLGSDTIDSMICQASSGDVLVRVNAYGHRAARHDHHHPTRFPAARSAQDEPDDRLGGRP